MDHRYLPLILVVIELDFTDPKYKNEYILKYN